MFITKITPTTKKTYNLYSIFKMNRSIGNMKKNYKISDGKIPIELNCCFVCGRKFNDIEVPYLGLVNNRNKNVFVCDDCAKKINEENEKLLKKQDI